MTDLAVTMADTDELVPYAGNAKEHPDWQVEQIAASIDQFGFNDPVGIWHDHDGAPIIVEGHGRVLAAKELGIKRVPIVTLDHLDDEGRRAYTLAHNKLTTNTGYDADVLAAELAGIENIDMADFGFDASEDGDAIGDGDEYKPTALTELFGFVPFSVAQATTSDWLYRKAAWLGLGIRSEIGRGSKLLYEPSKNPSIQSTGKNMF